MSVSCHSLSSTATPLSLPVAVWCNDDNLVVAGIDQSFGADRPVVELISPRASELDVFLAAAPYRLPIERRTGRIHSKSSATASKSNHTPGIASRYSSCGELAGASGSGAACVWVASDLRVCGASGCGPASLGVRGCVAVRRGAAPCK